MEYGPEKKRRDHGAALLWIVGTVLACSILLAGRGVVKPWFREAGEAVEALAVRLQAGMPVGEAAQTFCREVFFNGSGN